MCSFVWTVRASQHTCTQCACVCAGLWDMFVDMRLRKQLFVYTCANTHVRVGADIVLCACVSWVLTVSVYVCMTDSWSEQARDGSVRMRPAPATPGTCPAPSPTLAMGIPLHGGRENLPSNSGRKGATWPNCCPTGPRKPAPSPLNRTTLPSSRGYTYMQGHTTHTDTCVHPHTSAKHVLHSCAHMHTHALYTYTRVHMCAHGLHT